uniref:Homing endonuclease LAGLIDADG domain-containing protein n=1 Tax=Wolfiporia cocos TaxID=81056 RepID=A0A7G7YDX2_9APHY|nr:hypothetical protein [Wolfiporia cocos]
MSSVNKDLIYHLYSIFNSYVKTGPKFINRKLNKLTNSEHIVIYFSTLKYALFNWAVEDCYVKEGNKNIKIVPKDTISRLTPVSLAHWIMDDGSFNKSKGYLILCTDSYCKEDVLYLISILKTKFHLSSALFMVKNKTNNKIYYRIRINKSSIPTLIGLVKPYFISSMRRYTPQPYGTGQIRSLNSIRLFFSYLRYLFNVINYPFFFRYILPFLVITCW